MVKQAVKEKKQAINQIWLSFIFMVVILGNFFTVAGITYFYETNGNQEKTELYISDSNTEFPVITFGSEYPTIYESNFTTGYFLQQGINYLSYEKTPAYLGNNTWGIPINTSINRAQVSWRINIPEIENWIITDIDINITLPGDPDIRFFTGINNIFNPTQLSTQLGTVIGLDILTPGLTQLNKHYDVSLVNALKIKQDSQERPFNILQISIFDNVPDGMSGFANQLSFNITGYTVTTWNIETALIVSTTIWNILIGVVIVYSLDIFDLGGFVKTIRKTRRN